MVKVLGGAALAVVLSGTPGLMAAPPLHPDVCASLLDELTGPASPASAHSAARLHAWAERRIEAAVSALRAFTVAVSSREVLLATQQIPDVAASLRLLAHDAALLEQAQAHRCTWAPDAVHALKAH